MLLWLSIGWVFASALVAMLPMRWQYVPGVALLLAAPVLIGLIAQSVGTLGGLCGGSWPLGRCFATRCGISTGA